MPTRLRTNDLQFDDNTAQSEAFEVPLWGGYTNENNVFNSYRSFPTGTKVTHVDTRNTNSGFQGNGSRNFSERYQRTWLKTGSNSWDEIGG